MYILEVGDVADGEERMPLSNLHSEIMRAGLDQYITVELYLISARQSRPGDGDFFPDCKLDNLIMTLFTFTVSLHLKGDYL